MANNVSKAFKQGHNSGYKSAQSWDRKSELEKWVSAINREIVGTPKNNHSKDYNNGRKAGTRDFYKK